MSIILIGDIFYEDGPKGRVLNALSLLTPHISAKKLTFFSLNIKSNWEYDGFKVLPLNSFEDLEKYSDIIKNADIGLIYLKDFPFIKNIMTENPDCMWIIDSFSNEYVNLLKKHYLENHYAIKFNREQAEELASFKIFDINDCRQAKNEFFKFGVKRGFITLNKKGVYFFDKHQDGIILPETITRKKIDDAGDAFVKGVIYGLTLGKNIAFIAKKGIEFSATHINKRLKYLFTFGDGFKDNNY